MGLSFDKLKKELSKRNIALSHQRLKVLEYLADNRCHPTADQIYVALKRQIPTLSKTTVYNTLKILGEAGMVKAITIEDNETRYDIDCKDHGHFKCESCGTIYDFSIDLDSMKSGDLNGFKIRDKDVYFKGICPSCLSLTGS